jgi:hypothetical protein
VTGTGVCLDQVGALAKDEIGCAEFHPDAKSRQEFCHVAFFDRSAMIQPPYRCVDSVADALLYRLFER